VLLIAQGALQCFAPQKLKDVQNRLRPKGDYSGSALGSFFERLREKQASEPSALYRFSGLMLMGMGITAVRGNFRSERASIVDSV
jgi:hypothetical protein